MNMKQNFKKLAHFIPLFSGIKRHALLLRLDASIFIKFYYLLIFSPSRAKKDYQSAAYLRQIAVFFKNITFIKNHFASKSSKFLEH